MAFAASISRAPCLGYSDETLSRMPRLTWRNSDFLSFVSRNRSLPSHVEFIWNAAKLLQLQKCLPNAKTVRNLAADNLGTLMVEDGEGNAELQSLPCPVNCTVTITSWGVLYEGPGEETFWNYSDSERNKCHPYPIGYTATKVYKGKVFQQTIEAGADGPIFVVVDVGRATYSSNTASKAWSQVLKASHGVSPRVHGNRHFGFESPLVQKVLKKMVEQRQARVLAGEGDEKQGEMKTIKPEIVTRENESKCMEGSFRKQAGFKNKRLQTESSGDIEAKALLNDGRHFLSSSKRGNSQKSVQRGLSSENEACLKEMDPKEPMPCPTSLEDSVETAIDSMADVEGLEPSIPIAVSNASVLPISVDRMWKRTNAQKKSVTRKNLDAMSWRQQLREKSTVEQLVASDVQFTTDNEPEVGQVARVSKAVGNSIPQKKSEGMRSSRSLLELIQKWNKLNEWKTSSGERIILDKTGNKVIKVENQEKNIVVGDERRHQQTSTGSQKLISSFTKKHAMGGDNSEVAIGNSILERERAMNLVDRTGIEVIGGTQNGHHSRLVSTELMLENDTLSQIAEELSTSMITRLPSKTRNDSHLHRQGTSGIQLVADIRQMISNQRFEDALTTLRALKLSGMPVDEFIYEAFFPFRFDLWQKQVCQQLREGSSVLVSAPSGAGKMVAAECCLYENLAKNQRALFVTPYEELAKQHFCKFQLIYGSSNIGALWPRMRFQKDASLVIVTLATLVKVLREKNGPGGSEYCFFFEGVNMAVFDQFHTIGDKTHGGLWEEVLMLMNAKIKIVALCIPLRNRHDIVSWINSIRGPCRLVECRSDPVPKKYIFCDGSGLYPLLNYQGTEMNGMFKVNDARNDDGWMNQGQCKSFFLFGYDRPSLRYILNLLEGKLMLPTIVVFFDTEGCIAAFNDALEILTEGLLSVAEVAEVERRLGQLGDSNPELPILVDQAERIGLLRGFAAYDDRKLPIWLHFVDGLINDNLVKLIITTDCMLHSTNMCSRTMVLPVSYRITNDGISPLSSSEFLELKGIAGRRGYDTEGNVVFLKSFYSNPKEVVSLVQTCEFTIHSHFKPSYSLLLNLLARNRISEVKKILGQNLCEYMANGSCEKNTSIDELDQKVLNSLDLKAALELELFQELARINKEKLRDAEMFTRVDVRIKCSSSIETPTNFPGVLLAVLPGLPETFYLIFGVDNNFRLLPAGAFDHVYESEPTFDVSYKLKTGETIDVPFIPTKERWIFDHESGIGYIANGSSQSADFAKLLKQYPVCSHDVKEVNHIRKDIEELEGKILSLKRMIAITDTEGTVESDYKEASAMQNSPVLQQYSTWKESERLIKVLQRADAFAILDNNTAHVKLKPLGLLIARLHNVENELWIAMVLNSSSVLSLLGTEFAGITAAILPEDPQIGTLPSDHRNFTFKVAKRLQKTLTNLEMLQKQVASIQGSLTPHLCFDASSVGMVYAWARGKPGVNGFEFTSINDGSIAKKLKRVATFASLLQQACSETTADVSASGVFTTLHSLANRAEFLLSRYLSIGDWNILQR